MESKDNDKPELAEVVKFPESKPTSDPKPTDDKSLYQILEEWMAADEMDEKHFI